MVSMTESHMGERVNLSHLPSLLDITEGSTEEQRQKPWRNTLAGPITGLRSIASFTSSRFTCPRVEPGPFHNNQQSTKCHTDLSTGQSGGGNFSIEGPFSQVTVVCVKSTEITRHREDRTAPQSQRTGLERDENTKDSVIGTLHRCSI